MTEGRPPVVRRPGGTDLLLLGVGVLGICLSAPLTVLAAVPALALAFWRNLFGTVLLAPLAAFGRRAELRALDRRTVLRCGVAGVLLAAHFGTWISSLSLTSVASSVALVTTTPVWIAAYLRITGHPVSRRVWIGLALAVAGTVAAAGADVTVSTAAIVGDLLALAGAGFVAGYTVLGDRVRQTVSTTTYVLLCYGTCAAVLLVVCLAGQVPLTGFPLSSWLLILAITLCAQIAGHTVFNRVIVSVGPTTVALASLLEVPGSALLAYVLVGQVPPLLVIPGLLIVLAGIALVISSGDRAR